MINRYSIKYLRITLVLFLFPFVAFSQTPAVTTTVDKHSILIGEQLLYKVKASFTDGAFRVHWLNLPDSIAHFEVVDKTKIDTTTANNITTLEQTITFTSFDSGRWNTPVLPINFTPLKGDVAVDVFTDSIPVNVGYMPADSTGQLRDIKPIIEVTVENYLWYYIGGGILLLLIIGFIVWRYFKNRKKPELSNIGNDKISPYDEAMQELHKLQQINLQTAEGIREYHGRLSVIFKWYISRRQRISIMNKTTGDVLVHLTNNNLPQENIANAATALRVGDAVKFAKFLPPVYESEDSLNKIKQVIDFIQQKNTTT